MQFDPDFVVGYEVSEHLALLLDRAEALGLRDAVSTLGRYTTEPARVRSAQIYSANWVRSQRRMASTSNHEFKTVAMPGRVLLDLRLITEREEKLRTYSFEEACEFHFNHPKELLSTSTLTELFHDPHPSSQQRLLEYSVREAVLAQRMMDRMAALPGVVEMARVTGLNIDEVYSKGQMVRFWSQLCRFARDAGYAIPATNGRQEDTMVEGPINWMPEVGYHTTEPIAVLDFASLYPSIIIAHNLCYTTYVMPSDQAQLAPDQFQALRATTGTFAFVRASVKKGIVPTILEIFLDERKRVKRLLQTTTDPAVRAVLNGRQLALKVSANAIYGFTGAPSSKLQFLPIAETTIRTGADMLTRVRDLIQGPLSPWPSATVVYGDTDSVFVRFPNATVPESLVLARRLSEAVTNEFARPIRLEFEKIYFPCLLVNRKRYAGLLWTDAATPARIDVKGLENTSRGSCGVLVGLLDELLRILLFQDRVAQEAAPTPVHVVTPAMRAAAVTGASDAVRRTVRRLLTNGYDASQLIMTRGLWLGTEAEDYKTKQAHVQLAERIRQRDPTRQLSNGERVSYVYVHGAIAARDHEKSEEALYALQEGLPLDLAHYLHHQVKEPVSRLCRLFLDDREVADLFAGDHTRIVPESSTAGVVPGTDGTAVAATPTSSPTKPTGGGTASPSGSPTRSSGGGAAASSPTRLGGGGAAGTVSIGRFFTAATATTAACLGCRAQVSVATPLCNNCLPHAGAIYVAWNQQRAIAEERAATLAGECMRCQGNLERPFKCSNDECTVYFRRAQAEGALRRTSLAMGRVPDW